MLRDLAGRVGSVLGSGSTCKDIAKSRVQTVVDKFTAVIKEASANEAERTELTQTLDRGIMDGRTAVAVGRTDCKSADRQLADLERSIAGLRRSPTTIGPRRRSPPRCRHRCSPPTRPPAPLHPTAPAVRGMTDREIRFGIAAPFSGSARELGRQMKLGIETAFNRDQRCRRRRWPDAAAARRRRRL